MVKETKFAAEKRASEYLAWIGDLLNRLKISGGMETTG